MTALNNESGAATRPGDDAHALNDVSILEIIGVASAPVARSDAAPWINPASDSLADWAQAYAARGFYVLPLPPGAKMPPPRGWNTRPALTGPEIFEGWSKYPDANIGLGMGQYVALDPDVKDGKDGIRQLEDVFERNTGQRRPVTFIQRTPSGGEHWIFRLPDGVHLGNKTGALKGLDVDVRGGLSGYTVAAPSTHHGSPYTIVANVEPAVLPSWLAELLVVSDVTATGEGAAPPKVASIDPDLDALARHEFAETLTLLDTLVGLPDGDRMDLYGASRGWEDGAGLFLLAQRLVEIANWPEASLTREDVARAWAEHAAPTGKARHTWTEALKAVGDGVWEFGEREAIERAWAEMTAHIPSRQSRDEEETWPQDRWDQVGNVRRTLRLADGRLLYVREEQRWYECHPNGIWTSPKGARLDDVAAAWCARAMEAAKTFEAEAYDDTKKKDADGKDIPTKREKFVAYMDESSKVEMHTAVATQLRRRAEDFGVLAAASQFDADSHQLGVANGVIDLRTGELRDLRRDDYITKVSPFPYDATATAPRWEAFVASAFPDEVEQRALRLALGYSLVGGNKEQVGFIHHGVSGSGRSTMLKVLAVVMGGHFGAANSRSILQARRGGTPQIGQDMIDMRDRRLLALSETAEGAHLDNEAFKSITAADIRADRPHAKGNVQYQITGVIHVATNHLPHITPDAAIGRRLIVVPWLVSHSANRDIHLEAKLLSEAPGILAWLVRGAVEAQAVGLLANIPEAWSRAAQEHMLEEDEIAQWLEERTLPVANNAQIGADWTSSTDLHNDYVSWCFARRSEPMSVTAFGRRLREKGFDQKKPKGCARMRPLGLKHVALRGLMEVVR